MLVSMSRRGRSFFVGGKIGCCVSSGCGRCSSLSSSSLSQNRTMLMTMMASSLEIAMKSVAKYEIAEYRSNERPC